MRHAQFFTLIGLLLSLTACASSPEINSEKYQFSELTEVSNISDFQLKGWAYIDSRSVMVRSKAKTSYLLILSRPLRDLKFATNIAVTSTAGRVEARFDSVATAKEPNVRAPIERIYELKDRDQLNWVKTQIRNN